ncbi:hypothetical protein C8J57DRAFT_1395584 [Mycena rebaudengoi]|nr:hypothetical protein C8J57DRAFT_1395584 [Mycena rebaudengoi]
MSGCLAPRWMWSYRMPPGFLVLRSVLCASGGRYSHHTSAGGRCSHGALVVTHNLTTRASISHSARFHLPGGRETHTLTSHVLSV